MCPRVRSQIYNFVSKLSPLSLLETLGDSNRAGPVHGAFSNGPGGEFRPIHSSKPQAITRNVGENSLSLGTLISLLNGKGVT